MGRRSPDVLLMDVRMPCTASSKPRAAARQRGEAAGALHRDGLVAVAIHAWDSRNTPSGEAYGSNAVTTASLTRAAVSGSTSPNSDFPILVVLRNATASATSVPIDNGTTIGSTAM